MAELAAELVTTATTEVTCSSPGVEYSAAWHRLLHDRTSTAIAPALVDLPHANVTFVPYHLGKRGTFTPVIPQPTRRQHRAGLVADPPRPSGVPKAPCRSPAPTIASRSRSSAGFGPVRIQPRAGVATLQVTLADDSGSVNIVFFGRRHVAGIEPGAFVAATGVVGQRAGRLEIPNPSYQLLAVPHDSH